MTMPGDKTTTNFPKMGDENKNVRVGYRGDVAPSLQHRPRGGAKNSAQPQEMGAPGRAYAQNDDNVVPRTPERLGAKWAPQMLMSHPTAPESQQTGRNVRLFRSAVGAREFYDKAMYGQVQQ